MRRLSEAGLAPYQTWFLVELGVEACCAVMKVQILCRGFPRGKGGHSKGGSCVSGTQLGRNGLKRSLTEYVF